MKIYFCGSIAGGRKFVDSYKQIVDHLKQAGHEVLSEHIVKDDIFEWEKKFSPEEIYTRDVEMLDEAEAVIAEVSNPSLGVGYEICYAEKRGVPVLCLYQEGLFVSRMITGNTAENVRIETYRDIDELKKLVDQFLDYKEW
ncbi:hypothetical protein B6D60_04075 [candidate division KSB1 bacterium 4484_87]|nr:MAG: hypothetical protein B6D60_04075 [candidate division KSB1 bacterium 4484_87]